jgi:hypothetical protein
VHYIYFKLKMMQLKQKTNPFSEQVNVAENYEVEYWANKFGIRPMALREIIKSTGPNVSDIQKYLSK